MNAWWMVEQHVDEMIVSQASHMWHTLAGA